MNRKLAVALALVAITVVAVAYLFYPQMLVRQSILAVSNVRIEPIGSENAVTKEWTGSFWTILMTTDMNEQYGLYKFNDAESAKYGSDTVGDKKLVPQSEITIKVTPLRPYWERPLDIHTVLVYPETKSAHRWAFGAGWEWTTPTIGRFDCPVVKWGAQYWTAHTPFLVEIFKNNQKITGETIDTTGASQTIILRNPNDNSEWIAIKDLGKLGTGYSAPTIGNIAIMSPDTMFTSFDSVVNLLNYYSNDDMKFANYWFGGGKYYTESTLPGGIMLKAPDGSPGLYWRTPGPISSNAIPRAGDFPGIYVYDPVAGAERWGKPLGAKIFTDQPKDTQQANGVFQKDGKSVVSYLKSRGLQIFPLDSMDVWKQGWEITAERKVRIYLPYGSMSSLVTMQISTELADTVVWHPPVADIEITELSWVVSGKIGDKDILKIDLRQKSSVASTATITTVTTAGHEIFVNPTNQKVTLDAGQSGTVFVEVLNTGATEQKTGTLTVTITNELGAMTSQKSIEYTLLPKGVGATILTVITKDKVTGLAVSGIHVTVAWGIKSVSDVTSAGTITFDMEGYQGPATLTSLETTTYKSATKHIDIKVGFNTEVLELLPHGYVPPWWEEYWWLIILIIVIVIVAIIAAVIYKRRKR